VAIANEPSCGNDIHPMAMTKTIFLEAFLALQPQMEEE
jgi:hypothetical protein